MVGRDGYAAKAAAYAAALKPSRQSRPKEIPLRGVTRDQKRAWASEQLFVRSAPSRFERADGRNLQCRAAPSSSGYLVGSRLQRAEEPVGGMAVEAVAVAVIAPGGARVGVPCGVLDVAQ